MVLGIGAALLANNWREERKDQKRADHAMLSIVEELQTNRDAVHSSAEYHASVLAKLRAFGAEHKDDPGATPGLGVFTKGFIDPAITASYAWDVAANTGALESARYSWIVKAAKLYEDQARYQRSAEQVGQELYRRIMDGGPVAVIKNWRNQQSIVGMMAFRECELARSYGLVLPTLAPQIETTTLPAFCSQIPQR